MGKLSWKKTKGLDEWKTDGYYIEQTGDDPPTMVAHTRTAEGLVADKVGTLVADDEHETKTALLKRAKMACEQHRRGQREPEPKAAKLSVAGALDWQETKPGSGIWEATTDDGGRYTCTEIGAHWRAGYSFMGLVPLWPEQINLAGAQLLCEQHHAGRGLEWREGVGCWLADDNGERDHYACELDDDGKQWTATDQNTDTEIGHVASLNEAQARCQIHRGRRLLLGAKTEAHAADLGGPDRELGEWIIGRPPTTEVRAALSLKQAETSEEIGALEIELACKERAFRAERKRIEKEIAEIRERQIRLAAEVRHGLSAKVRCWRERDGDDWRYTDESGAELYREPAVTELSGSKQQKLCGDRTVPKAEPEAPPDSVPFEVADRLDGDGPNETPLERTDGSEPPASVLDDVLDRAVAEPPPLKWKRFRVASVGSTGKGEPGYRAEVPGGEYRLERGESTRLLRAFWIPMGGERLELPGEHATVKAAQAEAEQHWQSRLLWPGDAECGVLVDATNRYQLMRDNKGDWMAICTGGLDEKAKELGGGDIDEAKEACQDHFDAGRWTR